MRSPIFYMGNKHKLLPQLLEIFPKNIDTFVDFGCANGDIIDAMHFDVPELNFYGIDNDENMLELLNDILI